ncbi:hypothetical protein ACFV6G_26460 [Streptomyces lavendulae]|uniref:hypothetical protein n=1 Tax=Streptomyces lavendulae TaxID=1914 RepID=UPI0036CB79CE
MPGVPTGGHADDIRAVLRADPDTAPEDDGSTLLQMYACLPEVDGRAYDHAATVRRSGGPEWQALREEITAHVITVFSLWPK